MFKTKIAAAVALACLSSASLAQSKMGVDAGWYIGGHVGRSNTSFNSGDYNPTDLGTALGTTINTTKEEHDTSWKLLLGYNFDQNWALEGFYADLGEPKVKYSTTTAFGVASGEARIHNDAWGLAVKGTIPVHQQWDIYGRLGWTYNRSNADASWTWPAGLAAAVAGLPTSASGDHNRSDVLLGVGVEFKPQKNWGIRLEYENYGSFGNENDTGRTDSDMWTAGVVIRF